MSSNDRANDAVYGSLENERLYDFATTYRALIRNWRLISLPLVICTLLTAGYLATSTKKYTATATVLVEPLQQVNNTDTQANQVVDTAVVDSQVELIKSQKVLQATVEKLSLADDPELSRRSLIDSLRHSFFKSPLQPPTPEKTLDAVRSLLDVKRVDKTYTINVSFTSKDPEKAALIANAIAEAYKAQLLQYRVEDANATKAWLQGTLADLKAQAIAADVEVQRYKSSNNLITSGGRLINDQQLSQLNEQYISATVEAARADARLSRLGDIIAQRDITANVPEALSSTIINDLRDKYLKASKREQELEKTLGKNHALVVKLRADIAQYEEQAFQELKRIYESYNSDAKIAHGRVTELEAALKQRVATSSDDNKNLVDLQVREQQSEILRDQYQKSLQEYQRLQERLTFPIANARIITTASKPNFPSQPKMRLVMAIGMLGGLVLGVGAALWRESVDDTIRSPKDIRKALNLPLVGIVPDYALGKHAGPRGVEPARVPAGRLVRSSVDYPLSRIADTMRMAKHLIDGDKPGKSKIVGITSLWSGEGKTCLASNLAYSLAANDKRVLLVDADLRRHGLSKLLAPEATSGLVDILNNLGSSNIAKALDVAGGGKLHFVPAPMSAGVVANSADMLCSDKMKTFLTRAQQIYDYVIIDFPPVGELFDGMAASPILDQYIFITAWGKTSVGDLTTLFAENPDLTSKVRGVVLNKVDPAKLKHYTTGNLYNGSGYY